MMVKFSTEELNMEKAKGLKLKGISLAHDLTPR